MNVARFFTAARWGFCAVATVFVLCWWQARWTLPASWDGLAPWVEQGLNGVEVLLMSDAGVVSGLLWTLIAGTVGFLAGSSLLSWSRSRAARDPVRMYSTELRREASVRCQGRCERDGWLPWVRCHAAYEHADHWFPWSTGGKTSLANCVGSCAWHNLSKGGRWPSRGERKRIAHRRRSYWTGPQEQRTPGELWAGI